MPFAPNNALVAKCTSTILCHLRAVPLWGIALVILFLGFLRTRFIFSTTSRQPKPPTSNSNKLAAK